MPKSLLLVNNKPIIDYILDEIQTLSSISETYVITNDKFAKQMYDWGSNKPVKILNDGSKNENDKLGAIGDIQFAIEQENLDDDLLIIAGDSFFTFKLLDYYNFFASKNADCACAKEFDSNLNQFAIAKVDLENKLIDLEEKPANPKSNLVVYANYFYQRSTLPMVKQYLNEGNAGDAPGYFLQWLYKRKPVYIYKLQGEYYDIGTQEAYENVQAKMI